MRLNVKSDQIRSQQSVHQLPLPRTDAECFRIGPGDMPEDGHACIRPLLLDQPRQAARNGSPAQAPPDWRVFDLLEHGAANLRFTVLIELPVRARERSAAYGRYDRAATALRWQTRSSSLLLPPYSAILDAGCSGARPGGTRSRSCASTTSRRRLRCHAQSMCRRTRRGLVPEPSPGRWGGQLLLPTCRSAGACTARDSTPQKPPPSSRVWTCTASRSAVHMDSEASRNRASFSAAVRACVRLSASVTTSHANGLNKSRSGICWRDEIRPKRSARIHCAARAMGPAMLQRTIRRVIRTMKKT